MDLKEEALLGAGVADHWYYRAKARALDRVAGPAPGRVLDVGAGAGFFSRHLLARGATAAVCVDPGYEADRDDCVAGKPLLFRRMPPDAAADLVLMMDVLEHVDDDVGLARSYVSAAAPGTRLIATVPAFQWMWSGHDDFLEHRRRYTLTGLRHVLSAAGLQTEGGRYLYGFVLPAAMATRLPGQVLGRLVGRAPAVASQLRPMGTVASAVLSAACAAEAWLPGNLVAGLTAMAWGRVP